VPDIDVPDTEPEYVIAFELPTVPKLMVLPRTVPAMFVLPTLLESLIVPVNRDFDCVQCRVNVPRKAPRYVPDHVPVREPRDSRLFVAAPAVASCPTMIATTTTPVTIAAVDLLRMGLLQW